MAVFVPSMAAEVPAQSVARPGVVLGALSVTLRRPMNSQAPTAPPVSAGVVFEARKLRKVYHTGEVDVVALHGVDLELNAGELVCCSARPAAASPRC